MRFGYTITRGEKEIDCTVYGDMEWYREEWGMDGEFDGEVFSDGVDISDDITDDEWQDIQDMAINKQNEL